MTTRPILSVTLGCLCFLAFACGDTPPAPSQPGANSTAPAPAQPPAAAATPLKALASFRVEWISQQIPTEMQVLHWYDAAITLRNPTNAIWPARGPAVGSVNIAYHWLPAQGDKPVLLDGERTAFPHDIGPGETIKMDKVRIIAPASPGQYRLQISLVQEGVAWFESQGATPITVPVKVR